MNMLITTSVFGQAIFDYTFTPSTDLYENLQNPTILTNGVVWDEETFLLPLGFTFYVGNKGFDTVAINANGYLTFVNNVVSETYAAMIFGNVDLQDRGAGTVTAKSPISYQIDGNMGSQVVKIQYKNAGFFDGISSDSVSFQVWIYENLDKIEYRFGGVSISNPTLVFQGNTGAICGLFTANANNLNTGFTLANSAIFPDTAQFTAIDLFNLPSLNDLIPENTVYTFAYNHPVASRILIDPSLAVEVLGNPTRDFTTIQMILPQSSMISMEVFDMNGKRLQTKQEFCTEGKNKIRLDLSTYTSGMYWCRIKIGQTVITKKLVKI